MSSLLGTSVIAQIGLLVHDIDKTSRVYADFFGLDVPTPILTDAPEIARTEFAGAPSPARARLAFFNMGSLQLELIEPDAHPSTWRNHLDEHGEGVHHIAFQIEGMAEKIRVLEGKGYPLQQKGEYTGGRYAYMDTAPDLKVLVELLEND
ncbi:VOC family protein [Paenibacillus albicereus]|uniref:VOC family protein n=1 Tax=Paenibacillus albicereus TaxID=2726185 RepID=A0A6H2H1I4_9BACL|nr:VOC family protein [Paenibacillus albicereus]QJC53530.1 VOC family protein [Paenibacillus albicereus]